jgi:hypothetical protein
MNEGGDLSPAQAEDLKSQLETFTGLLSGMESAAAGFPQSNALIAEMRLILPSRMSPSRN